MDLTLIGVVIGAILILFLIRGVGFAFARNAARTAYRNGMNAEIQRPNRRPRVSVVQPPEQVYLGGENRYERGPGMEAPPVYTKADTPPEYVDVTNLPAVPPPTTVR
jgi:hypothetical protein